jgi:hypothetical protein
VGGYAYYLVDSPTGPIRGTGDAYRLGFALDPADPQGFLQLSMSHIDANNGSVGEGSGWPFVYSPCPTELDLGGSYLVPFY